MTHCGNISRTLLYEVRLQGGGEALVYVLLEHKSYPDPLAGVAGTELPGGNLAVGTAAEKAAVDAGNSAGAVPWSAALAGRALAPTVRGRCRAGGLHSGVPL